MDPNIPIVKKLTGFYYDELVKEYENKPDKLRRDESERRAKRSYLFIKKYKEYEKNGFQKEDIVKIFGIDKQQQRIMDHWIDEFLPYGISTSIFAKAGMGKSNTSSFICQMVLVMKPQWDIITDLPIVFSPLMDPHNEYEELRVFCCSDLFWKSPLIDHTYWLQNEIYRFSILHIHYVDP